MLTIWHNPRCRKSREALALLEESGKTVTVRRYLETRPSEQDIQQLLAQLGFEDPRMLMRRGERIYRDLNLKIEKDPSNLVKQMAENPILIERPVVTNGIKAIVGRPLEAIKALL